MNILKVFLLTGTLAIAVSTVDSTYAADSTMTTTPTTRATPIGKNPAVIEIRQSIKASNAQFVEQRRALRQELKAAPKSEKAAIRAELRQLNQQHRVEVRQLTQSLRTEVHSLRQHNTTTPTTTAG